MKEYKLVPVEQLTDVADRLLQNGKQQEMVQPEVEPEVPSTENAAPEDVEKSTVPLKSPDVDSIIHAIPKELQHKCKAILAYLINAGVDHEQGKNDYKIVYEGGVIRSPLPELLRWTISPNRNKERPWDQMRFFRILTDLGIPKSLYGKGKYKLANVASKLVPIAIVKKNKRKNNGTTDGAFAAPSAADDNDTPPEKRWKRLF